MLTGRAQIAIKQEAVAGTAETLAAADAILVKGESTYDTNVTVIEREAMSASLDPRGAVLGQRAASIKFSMYLRGSYNHSTGANAAPVAGSTLSDFDIPFKGCGLNVTVSGSGPNEQASYKPSSTTISDETTGAYCTVGFYLDGKRYLITGAQGNLALTFAVGQPILAEFEYQGVYNAPADVALLAPVYNANVEPAFLGASLSLIGSMTTAKISSLKLDMGNTITMRPYPNSTAGIFTAQITSRKPVGSFDPEEALVSSKDWFAEWIAATTGAITTGVFPSGGTNYNQFQLIVPKAQYTKVGLGNRDGIAIAPHDFICWANSDAGEDCFEFIQT